MPQGAVFEYLVLEEKKAERIIEEAEKGVFVAKIGWNSFKTHIKERIGRRGLLSTVVLNPYDTASIRLSEVSKNTFMRISGQLPHYPKNADRRDYSRIRYDLARIRIIANRWDVPREVELRWISDAMSGAFRRDSSDEGINAMWAFLKTLDEEEAERFAEMVDFMSAIGRTDGKTENGKHIKDFYTLQRRKRKGFGRLIRIERREGEERGEKEMTKKRVIAP